MAKPLDCQGPSTPSALKVPEICVKSRQTPAPNPRPQCSPPSHQTLQFPTQLSLVGTVKLRTGMLPLP